MENPQEFNPQQLLLLAAMLNPDALKEKGTMEMVMQALKTAPTVTKQAASPVPPPTDFADVLKALENRNHATLTYQPGGIFSQVGMENEVISTHIRPQGLGARLPVYPSNSTDPRFGVLTGFTAETGSRPVYPCEDAPKGMMKAGAITAQFGRVAHQTQTIEIDTLFGEGRGVNTNLRLMGQVLGQSALGPNMSQEDMLNLVVKSEMVGVGVQFERDLARLLWRATPANNTAGGGHKEFPGLDLQITTGIIDADTGVALPSLDSFIENFAYGAVGGTTRDIVRDLTFTAYFLQNLADRTGMSPVEWLIVMRPELWYELSAIWPCRYLTQGCTTLAGANPISLNDGIIVRMRDEMRANPRLDLNGRSYEVVLDDGIFEHDSTNNGSVPNGSYASSVYFVPITARGSFPVTYWEHKDYRGLARQVAPMGQGASNLQFWTDAGRFMWAMRQNLYCFDMQAKIEPRVVLRTPHLAAKLQNVLYTPPRHTRSWDPTSSYWVNGGLSVRNTPVSQAVWK